jgi:hypothetical protein
VRVQILSAPLSKVYHRQKNFSRGLAGFWTEFWFVINRIYCDESRQTKDRFMVIGGFVIPQGRLRLVNQTLQKFRDEERMHAELKWTKVTSQKLNEYRRFVDYFFALNNNDKLHFHAIIFDNSQIDHNTFSQGDKEIGFQKFYYQFLLQCFGRNYHENPVGEKNEFIVHPDRRSSKYSLEQLRTILNLGMRRKFGVNRNCFLSIEPLNSKSSDLLQLADIILGAIGFQKNGWDLIANTRVAKIELAAHIASQAGLRDLKDDTRYGRLRFKIWNFRLRAHGR